MASVLRRVIAEQRTALAVIGPRGRDDKARISHLGAIEPVAHDELRVHGTRYSTEEALRRVRVVDRQEDLAAIRAAQTAYHEALAELDRAAASAWGRARPTTYEDLQRAWEQVRREVGEWDPGRPHVPGAEDRRRGPDAGSPLSHRSS